MIRVVQKWPVDGTRLGACKWRKSLKFDSGSNSKSSGNLSSKIYKEALIVFEEEHAFAEQSYSFDP